MLPDQDRQFARSISLRLTDVGEGAEPIRRQRLRGWIESDRAGLFVDRRLTQACREWDAPGSVPRSAVRRDAALGTVYAVGASP